jgi:hypothetical protein
MAKNPNIPKSLDAEAFHLCDQKGTIRASLSLLSNGMPHFQLNGPDGNARIAMQVEPTGRAVIVISDKKGQGLVGFSADEAEGTAGMRIANPDGSTAFEVGYYMNEDPRLQVRDRRGNLIWEAKES